MSEPATPQPFEPTWAILEIMGHIRHAGLVRSETFGATAFFRIDIPAMPEQREGTRVKDATPACTKLYGAGSIYCLTPCTEEFARKALEQQQPARYEPLALPVPGFEMLDNEDDDDDDDDEEGRF